MVCTLLRIWLVTDPQVDSPLDFVVLERLFWDECLDR